MVGIRFRETKVPQPSPQFVGHVTRSKFPTLGISDEWDVFTSNDSAPLSIKRSWDELHPGPPYTSGGPFTLIEGSYPLYQVKGEVEWVIPKVLGSHHGFTGYKGGFSPLSFPATSPYTQQVIALGLDLPTSNTWFDPTIGNDAYLSARPRIEGVDTGVFLGELKDLPDMLHTTATGLRDLYKDLGGSLKSLVMQPKSVANHFLNHVFGWAPFLSDISNLYNTYTNQNRLMDNIERQNGRDIRRVRSVVDDQTTEFVGRQYFPNVVPYSDISFMLSPRTIDGKSCRGFTDTIRVTKNHTWFEGVYKFYLSSFDRSKPDFDSNYRQAIRLMSLYGLRISPNTIYKLIPWSWLVDWFTKLGNQIAYLNSVAYDGLTNKYAYVMRTKEEFTIYNSVIFAPPGYPDVHVSWDTSIISKDRREAASPFGFSVSWDQLTTRQLAILTALGITRL